MFLYVYSLTCSFPLEDRSVAHSIRQPIKDLSARQGYDHVVLLMFLQLAGVTRVVTFERVVVAVNCTQLLWRARYIYDENRSVPGDCV